MCDPRDTRSAGFSADSLSERNAQGDVPQFEIVLTHTYHRKLRVARWFASLYTACLTAGFSLVMPAGAAVILAVLSGVGLFALFQEILFNGLFVREKGAPDVHEATP